MFIRFIIYSIALYFLMKAVKIVIGYFNKVTHKERPNVTQTGTSTNKVNKKDIIEAEFEEISDDDEKQI